MRRKLLLLGNPGIVGQNYVPSVPAVVRRYKEYFKSEVGGYWTDDEIIEEPDGYDISSEETWLTFQLVDIQKNADYSIILFVGHGGAYHGKDLIELSKGKIIPLSCFLPLKGYEDITKRTIIVDACRSLVGGTSEQLILESKSFSGNGQLMGESCREYYNQLIENCEPHIELIQSTLYGSVANSTERGTAFSDALFSELNAQVPLWNDFAMQDRCGQFSNGFTDILLGVQKGMVAYNQVPQYSRYGGNGDFPIYAVWRAVDRFL